MVRCRFRLIEAIVWVLAGSGSGAWAGPVINEVFYDPAGVDAGREFVELYADAPESLEGLRLEFGNGSAPDQWTVVWTGSDQDWIEAGRVFVIGSEDSLSVDAHADLALQNGPDGLRIVRNGVELDRVGWGALVHPEYYESRPAEGTGPGKSLARVTDGGDTQDNATDFSAVDPSPGRVNAPRIDVGISLQPSGRSFPIPALASNWSITVRLENLGREFVPGSSIRVWMTGREVPSLSVGLDPGSAVAVSVTVPAGESDLSRAEAVLVCTGDQIDENNRAEYSIARSPGPLRFRRIHPHPRPESPEWIEIESLEPVDRLTGWRVMDAAGGAFTCDESNTSWPSGRVRRAVDPRFASDDAEISGAGWPSLNNSEGSDGSADTLFLIDPRGYVRDWAAFGAIEKGGTWVRVDGAPFPAGPAEWEREATDPTGTPAARHWTRDHPYVSLRRHHGGVWFDVTRAGEYSLEVFDLLGRSVWRSTGRAPEGRGVSSRWDGRDREGRNCAEGVYVLQSHIRDEAGFSRSTEQMVMLGR